ncbi:family 8 carbohydrate esterase [Melampsora larici-populina 98AG31]|uniref:Pectinesterase n=1 Tax=Melampsora larici-populina (strain 98AG31 / pathotype 3-4-7) TaxID=747676 RepID=F4RA04_MELLP|nr:family 8 carbohydrate esterase [Melampsora larici-populina 98AG31]EGG10654.1 family 8 carbohydrate esterase [Melampsora larici-populina 98AG31]
MNFGSNHKSFEIFFILSIIIAQVICERFSETNLPPGTIVVKPGKGTLSAAFTQLKGRKGKQFIFLKKGVYYDNAKLNDYEDGIIIQGEGGTKKSYLDNLVTIVSSVKGTGTSSALRINVPNVNVYSITFQNTFGPGFQAVALTANGDNHIYDRCAFLGFQDTLYDYRGTHYFFGCYIEGAIDFIFGGGRSFYDNCVIGIKPNKGGVQEITANDAGSPGHLDSIFVFDSPNFVDLHGVPAATTYYGRAWGPKPQVVIQNPNNFGSLHPDGWDPDGVGSIKFDGSDFRELPLKTKRGKPLKQRITKERVLGDKFRYLS